MGHTVCLRFMGCIYIFKSLYFIVHVARAHEMMTDKVGATAGRSAELSPDVDWSGRRRVGTIVGGIYVYRYDWHGMLVGSVCQSCVSDQ